MKRYHLLLVMEEVTSSNRSKILEEVSLGEFADVEEMQDAFDDIVDRLGLVEESEED